MGLSIDDMIENVRLRLGTPRASAPDDQATLNAVCSHVRSLLRHRRATGNPWNLNDLTLQVVPNSDTYLINAADFGQPLAVTTYDPTNPVWIPRYVKIYEPQNLILDIPTLPNAYAANAFIPWDASNCTAQRVAFYWRDNQAYAQFWPQPNLNAQYKIRYLQGASNVNAMTLATSPLPEEDDDLVCIRAAITLLSISDWFSPDTNEGRSYNAEKRKDLGMTLANDEREFTRQFEAAVRITTGPRTYQRWNPTVG